MDPELLARISAEVMASKNLPPERQATVDRYTRRIVNKILYRCHREDVPPALEMLAAEIVEAALKADGAVPELTEDKEVASVTRGDTAISYRAKPVTDDVNAFLKDFDRDLTRFKKMNLPRDIHDRS